MIKSFIKNNKDYLIVTLISILVFCSIYGIRVLNPTYTDWLMAGGDLSQHYLGWVAYRKSAWHFPIGLVDTLAYPNLTSIMFTDSIPLLAIPFKIFSPILPSEFQFFGLWGICSFILQGLLSVKIIKNFTNNSLILILVSLLFLYTPVMIGRMYGHTSLAGHWILLLMLDLLFSYKENSSNNIYIYISIVGAITTCIHMYFVPMNGIILLGYCLLDILKTKKIKRSLYSICVYLLVVAIITYLLGGFSSSAEATASGLGNASANLNTFLNPQGWSVIFKDYVLYGDVQYEGFGYIGAGVILLVLVALVLFISNNKITNKELIISIIAVFILELIFSLSNVVTLGSNVLFEYKLPNILIKIWSIFRSTGRFIWVCIYLIIISSLIVILKNTNNRFVIVLLVLCVFFQIYDINKILISKHDNFSNKQEYESLLTCDKFWDEVKEQNIKHFYYADGVDYNFMFSITDYALRNNMTTNYFYFAREIGTGKALNDALSNPIEEDIFVFSVDTDKNLNDYDLHYYKIDNHIFGTKQVIKGFDESIIN